MQKVTFHEFIYFNQYIVCFFNEILSTVPSSRNVCIICSKNLFYVIVCDSMTKETIVVQVQIIVELQIIQAQWQIFHSVHKWIASYLIDSF